MAGRSSSTDEEAKAATSAGSADEKMTSAKEVTAELTTTDRATENAASIIAE